MKIKILGVTKEIKSGISKKTGKPYKGYFVSYGYKRDDMDGIKAEDTFVSEEMVVASNYVPKPGDLCDLVYTRGGYIEAIKYISKGELT